MRWNKPGAEDVIAIAREAQAKLPSFNKKAFADAANVTYATLNKWLPGPERPMADAEPALPSASTEPTPVLSAPSTEDDRITFDIEKVEGGRLRITIAPADIRTFLRSL